VQHEDEDILRQMYVMDKEKEQLKTQVYTLHKMAKRYQALERSQYQERDPAEVEEGLARAAERANALRAVMGRLSSIDPRIADSLAALQTS